MKTKHYMAGILAFLLFLMPITAFADYFGGGDNNSDVIGPTDDGASTSIGQGSVFTGPVTGTFGSGGSNSGSSSSNSGSSSGSGGSGSTIPPLGQGYFTPPSDEEIAKSIADLIVGDVIDDPSLGGGYKVFDSNGNERITNWTSCSSDGSLTKYERRNLINTSKRPFSGVGSKMSILKWTSTRCITTNFFWITYSYIS